MAAAPAVAERELAATASAGAPGAAPAAGAQYAATLDDIKQAAARIAPHAHVTPVGGDCARHCVRSRAAARALPPTAPAGRAMRQAPEAAAQSETATAMA